MAFLGSGEGVSDLLHPLLLFPWSDCVDVTPAAAHFPVPARPSKRRCGGLRIRPSDEQIPMTIYSLFSGPTAF